MSLDTDYCSIKVESLSTNFQTIRGKDFRNICDHGTLKIDLKVIYYRLSLEVEEYQN